MTTIINNPPGNNSTEPAGSGVGLGMVIGIIVVILVIILAILLGRSYYLRDHGASSAVGGSVNVQVPASGSAY